ncbi:MAG: hypothetical protein A2268_10880 [Candidatus Raymondbacteria bacterium RifOxyA12_full_50_37]|uniref:Uncharacterized protein n=1 Tax=Candidatus Raymondbacteria bacterium RIFOXYD12_FULL_49_13 TaxID=1817890 RepID=A0A1F7F288_UNCRA|nr:MAG: hypothetical protein A2268_10880 [Candidatus Raymondbacteria bacterium RifOxyA12_full_50_37]OGJ85515.1 MAG: hypothetical protein A2248_12665 [Candidatus Raymondbacteria bacterium RIFOXYA2_FULL_49_16]OGJ95018.1 MAG: hypothetical protein A2453_07365 [Candidatus Raymondbacteria bacterium RIFOXYC2_FULL_50_21]OGK00682.1 MAG: hypothetical protein A2519_20000 [Candidatus Raymondbacteria bacterium RIFOXYD12_FULL_49_13]OGK01287.1 MAG: hypothetical protein A2350_08355 [Candidatus Raymondbacteria 
MVNKVVLTITLSMCFLSCSRLLDDDKKEPDEIIISGTIFDNSNKRTLDSVQITLFCNNLFSWDGEVFYSMYDEKTDSTGIYNINYTVPEKYSGVNSYKIQFRHQSYDIIDIMIKENIKIDTNIYLELKQ